MDANFSPEFLNYNNKGTFVFWAQKVIPLVYDNSLSYYETLCKVVDYLNNVVENLDTVEDNLDSLHSAYGQLEEWVNATIAGLNQIYVTQTELQLKLNQIRALIEQKQDILTFEDSPVPHSNNPVTSEGIYNALALKADVQYSTPAHAGDILRIDSRGLLSVTADNTVHFTTQHLTDDAKEIARNNIGAISANEIGNVFNIKGEVANIAALPSSGNSVGDVYYVSSESCCYIWIESTAHPTGNWEVLGNSIDLSGYVTNRALATALALKEDKLTFDSAPTTGSTNPVTSGGVYTALSTKLNKQYAPGTYDAGQLMTVDLNGNIVNTPDTTIKFEEQTLTIAQRKTARDNIEAVSMDELDTKADKVSKIQIGSTGNVTQTIMSNNVYEFTGSLNSLTIVLAVSDESYPVYKFCFNTPATLFSLTLPNNVVFPMDWVLEPSMHYEINIENDYMSFKRWKL